MNWFGTFRHRFRSLWRRGKLKREIDEELRLHLEQAAAENIAAGMSPEEAAREARKRFGNLQRIREDCRDARGASFGDALLQDIGFGLRLLRKHPGFSVLAAATLALGIGANTAIFSIIDGVLLRPLPYPHPRRLVTVCECSPRRGFSQVIVRPAVLREWREQNSVFEQLGGQVYESVNLTGIERPEHLNAAWTTANYFSVFGVPPLIGRTFDPGDALPGRRAVVLSYGLWQRSFGGDRKVVGKSITLNGLNFRVIGVMPRDFRIFQPTSVFGLPTGDVQPRLWMAYTQPLTETKYHFFLVFGRLKPGITVARAQNQLSMIAARLGREESWHRNWDALVTPLKEQVVGRSEPALLLLLGAVGFVLGIACANVAGLSLARCTARFREFAVRSALGASRLRLARQLLAESAILALLGGGLGILLARWGLTALLALQPAGVPRLGEIRLNGPVLWFTLAVSLLTGLAFGLVPAVYASRPDLNTSLKDGAGRAFSEGRLGQQIRRVLVSGEVALAMMLLVGAGLMAKSLGRLIAVNPGFEPGRLLSFDFSLAGRAYVQNARRLDLIRRLRHRVQAKPGVSSVATVYGLPFGTMLNAVVGTELDRRQGSGRSETEHAAWRVVSPDYFTMMGIGVAEGRTFSEDLDTEDSRPVVVINESFARKFFAGEDPVGRRIRLFTMSTNWQEIVGVVHDVKLTGLDAPSTPEVYQPDSQRAPWMFSLVVRSTLPRAQIVKMVRTAAAAEDPDMPPFNVRTMEQAMSVSLAPHRFTVMLISLFAALALALTVVGIYGVVSYFVSQQTREIGIRIALGASRLSVLGQMLRRGMTPVLVGIAIGLPGSFALGRLMAAQLFGVGVTDPATFAGVAVLLLLASLAACYLPARRATRIDPMTALRYE